jgi:hypothetical protein
MGYWYWGPPPEPATLVAVGFDDDDLRDLCGDLRLAGRIDNGLGVDNDEQGTPIWICRDRMAMSAELWESFRRP